MAHFEVTASQNSPGNDHSKLFKIWAITTPETNGREHNGSGPHERITPGQEAGVYSAWYFVPTGYVANSDWANVMQWKMAGRHSSDPEGDNPQSNNPWYQIPAWHIDISRADSWGSASPPGYTGGMPVLVAANWRDTNFVFGPSRGGKIAAVPTGRWFQISANLIPGVGIDVTVDGVFWQRLPEAEFYVGLGSPTDPRNLTADYGSGYVHSGWIWGVGHYGGVGRLWVDDASFTRR